jgi:hypothetical protein
LLSNDNKTLRPLRFFAPLREIIIYGTGFARLGTR